MNCAGLRSDIDKLKQEFQAFEANLKIIRESEKCSKKLRDAMESIGLSSVDPILEKYLEDFQEQNPEILPVIALDERMDILDAEGGDPVSVSCIVAIDGERVLIGGYEGAFCPGSYDGQGELTLDERIDIKNVDGEPEIVNSILATDDGRVLVGGNRGAFYEGSYDDRGKFTLGGRIDARDAKDNPASIYTIADTKDGYVLVGGGDGVFYVGSYNEQGKLTLGERIDIKNSHGKSATVRSIAVNNDGHVLVGGYDGVLYTVIGGAGGVLCTGSYDERGGLVLGERIEIKDADESWAYIFSVVATEDGRVLVGGLDGAFYTGFYSNLKTLKQRLPEIVEKGEA